MSRADVLALKRRDKKRWKTAARRKHRSAVNLGRGKKVTVPQVRRMLAKIYASRRADQKRIWKEAFEKSESCVYCGRVSSDPEHSPTCQEIRDVVCP